MNIDIEFKLHNKFELEVKDSITGEIKQKAIGYNVVLNQYFERFVCTGRAITADIAFGRGTGTISETRTSLFSKISNKSATVVSTTLSFSNSSLKKKITLNANEFVGETITEVGFYANNGTSNYVTTHALLKDSEGNQISITKTDTDIITIYATLYLVMPDTCFGGKATWVGLTNPALNSIIRYFILESASGSSGAVYFSGSTLFSTYKNATGLFDIWKYNAGNASFNLVDLSAVKDYVNMTIKSPTSRLEVTNSNGLLKSIGLAHYSSGSYGSYGICFINLPCPEIWPGQQVTGLAIGSGDGVNCDFDIKCGEIRPNSEVVKVNGVVKTRDVDYTIINDSYYCSDQCNSLSWNKPVWYNTTPENNNVMPYTGSGVYESLTLTNYLKVDLEEPKVAKKIVIYYQYAGATLYQLKIQGSNDNSNWTTVMDSTINVVLTVDTRTIDIPNDTAYRYYRWYATSNSGGSSFTASFFEILGGTPALHFLNPPLNGEAINIDFITDYIWKTKNHVMDFNFTLKWKPNV